MHCVREMLPYLNAAGHYHYARCAHLYLQQMQLLPTRMAPDEYEKLTSH